MKIWNDFSDYYNTAYKGRHGDNVCSICIYCDPKNIHEITKTCNAMGVLPLGDDDTLSDYTRRSKKLIDVTYFDDCSLRDQTIFSDKSIGSHSISISLDCTIKKRGKNANRCYSF